MNSITPVEKPEADAGSAHENNATGTISPRNPAAAEHEMDDIGIFALAKILCDLNPYTDVTDDTTGITTMSMVVGTPEEGSCPECQAALENLAKCIQARIPSITVEVEQNYGTSWSFKGQTQTIKAALRVPYTFKVTRNKRTLWQQTEHLLIGFAGAAGGG